MIARRHTLALVAAAMLIACRQDDKPRGTPPLGATPPGAPTKAALQLVVNGHPVAPRTILASTSGGETVHLALSSVAGRTCDQLFADNGVTSLGTDEVLVHLDLSRPIFAERKHALVANDDPAWLVTEASWPGGQDGAHGSAELPPQPIATQGGALTVHYAGNFAIGAASPTVTLAIDGPLDVKPCGDRPRGGAASQPQAQPQPIDVRVGPRRLAIAGARITWSDRGAWSVELSSRPMACPTASDDGDPGDVSIEIRHDDAAPFFYVHGDLVPVQLNVTPRGYDGVVIAPDAPLERDGAGPVGVAIDVATADVPFTIHGRVTAMRCPR